MYFDDENISITPLGAGQDVGRSCILLHMGNKNIMLDCGMHMGYQDERRFPDFSYITLDDSFTQLIDCVIISHFHLDHCGALPYFTERMGYSGPIFMTLPTKAISPILLEDLRHLSASAKSDTGFYTEQMIKNCMKKVTAVNLHQVIRVDEDIEIKPYYAGHVLGAAMFWIKVKDQSVVYTGDFNMTPDRHLGAAWIDKCNPNLLITESTYATTIRDSKRCREREFIKKVHECISRGGKVLIPVFALGRAQELCILIETYWERMNIKVPVYFASGLTEKANKYYKLFISWTNQKIKNTFMERNMFEFRHIKHFDRSYKENPGPMVVFASPGMLHAGMSLNIFRSWAPDPKNMLIMPGYCVAGTVGNKVLSGEKDIVMDQYTPNSYTIRVKLQVEYISFSAHADAKGIMQLIEYCNPANVLLVHGEAEKMKFLKSRIEDETSVPCYMPANGETCEIATPRDLAIDVSTTLLKEENIRHYSMANPNTRERVIGGILVVKDERTCLMDPDEACEEIGVNRHVIRFTCSVKFESNQSTFDIAKRISRDMKAFFLEGDGWYVQYSENTVTLESILVKVEAGENDGRIVHVSWTFDDELIGNDAFNLIRRLYEPSCASS